MDCIIIKKWVHGDIKKIAKEQNIEEKDLLKLLDVPKSSYYKVLKGKEFEFHIKIYSDEEFEEIEKKVKQGFNTFSEANRKYDKYYEESV